MEQFYPYVHLAAVAVFSLAVAYGGLSDLRSFRIPNWTSLAALACFFPAALAAGWGMSAVLAHLGAGAAVLGAGFILFALGLFGGGDVKLLAAIAVWTGWESLPAYLLVVVLIGGVLALALVAFRRLKLTGRAASIAWVRQLHSEKRDVPYGVAIAAAAIVLLPKLEVLSPAAEWFATSGID